MRKLPLVLTTAAMTAAAAPALAADLSVTVDVPRLNTASYHRPYVAVWIENPDQSLNRSLAVWYQQTRNAEGDGKDWLKDMRTWWRKGGREIVRVPFRWGGPNTANGSGSSELGAVRVNVTR